MNNINFYNMKFITSIINYSNLGTFSGIEVAFLGYSNVGKSTMINCLSGNNKIARISKLPGRTKTINFFHVLSDFRIVDFPGYGYSKINYLDKKLLEKSLFFYLKNRECLKGIVLLSDIRFFLKSFDEFILQFLKKRNLFVLIILTKSDKISKREKKKIELLKYNKISHLHMNITICSFSKFYKNNIQFIRKILSKWYFLSKI
ncbi:ribosome biogenesis GTP-binding protein YihA/YsxC [Buchnera aphidicola]|uniref:Probable GTP-binding protein EngB n=1 Tax=Buchnera aphidicola subsp. Cinara cedri (strain Cc) TaxID=372461 RepID=Q057H1_BUCCC|nr:ribosome biogenesis GTP-binding protein YihA/YsxC [Buchnera aphidicola]ABJ90728.1 putative GTPase, involved in coordination of cell cycle, engB family [Buchnera aphidicola BCc]